MGKNKKMNSAFKVAGAKSLKLKAKAKAVKKNLKNVNIKSKDKISELDKQFIDMRKKSIQEASAAKKNGKKSNANPLPNIKEKVFEVQCQSQKTMDSLNNMKL